VILNERALGYVAEIDDHVDRAIAQAGADARRDRPGGVFVVHSARLDEADRILLLSAARVVLDGSQGSIGQQLARVGGEPARLPRLVPSVARPPAPEILPRPDSLLFDNGFGGFSADGREYVIHLEPGESTPAPWVNVVANRRLGFVVSESGGGHTWAENSGENRLTPWRNDPVSDEPAEVLYLRDEETAAVWTPTPLPAPADGAYQIRYGAGYATFLHRSHGLEQSLRLWVPPDDPVKLVELGLTNRLDRPRRVTVTYYVEWVLGATRDRSQGFVVPEFDPASEAMLARNSWNEDFAGRVAFVAASEKLHGLTADRTEFLGRHGSYAAPAAMGRIGLASAVRPGLDPCAVLQLHLDLAPGATVRLHFMLGEAAGRDEALGLVTKYRDRSTVEAAWADLHRHWDALLGAVTVHTPDPALDLMLNRWLPYQVLSSRLWGRTGYYQSGGAFGFRDQLQDVAALIHCAPTICRDHILEAARHQFEAGDVLHWWHPPAGAGVRTRCSDDLLWLPFITAHYVEATGDETILSEEVPFLEGEPLESREVERYARFEAGERRCDALPALPGGDRARPHGGRARVAAVRERRLERRDEPRGDRRSRRERVARLVSLRDAHSLCRRERAHGRHGPGGDAATPGGRAARRSRGGRVGRGMVPARILRRRHAARIGRACRVPDRLPRPVLGGPLVGGGQAAGRLGDGGGGAVPGTGAGRTDPSPHAALRGPRAGPRLHPRLPSGHPGKRWPVHPCGDLGALGAGRARRRRARGRPVPAAAPDPPRAHA
jgi:cyclic beta-1,2-glucan synthetase